MDVELQARIDQFAKDRLTGGQSVIPIARSKKPAIEWAAYYQSPMPVEQWRYPGCNLALVTGEVSGVVVVDCDSDEAVVGWLKTKRPTPLRVKSKRGMHFYYRHPGPGHYVKSDSHIRDAAGFEYDVKGDRSYVVMPPSLRGGHQYQVASCTGNVLGHWLMPQQLPFFEIAWRPERAPSAHTLSDAKVRDGLSYIKSIQAVQGSGGDKATYRAVCKLRDRGMTECQALAALMEWNQTNAKPAWSPRELHRKLQSAFAQAARNLETSAISLP